MRKVNRFKQVGVYTLLAVTAFTAGSVAAGEMEQAQYYKNKEQKEEQNRQEQMLEYWIWFNSLSEEEQLKQNEKDNTLVFKDSEGLVRTYKL